MKIKSFRKYLIEMPLPKDMDADALNPKGGKYSKAQPEKALAQHGQKVGKGSSRVAYRIHVEKEQFKDGHEGLPETHTGKIDTVIKLALNGKGVAQNEQEMNTFDSYGHMGFLLPIIDSSREHKINVILQNKEDSSYEDYQSARDSYSNWIQMPFVEQIKSPQKFNKIFTSFFGQILNACQDQGIEMWQNIDFQSLRDFFKKAYSKIQWDDVRQYINETQEENLHNLYELYEAGLGMGDLERTANWGVYKGKPVILDYGFDSSTVGLYSGAQIAEAFVDRKGNINLKISKVAPRRSFY